MSEFLFEVIILFKNFVNVIKVLAIADSDFIQLIELLFDLHFMLTNRLCFSFRERNGCASYFRFNQFPKQLLVIYIMIFFAKLRIYIILEFWLCIPCPPIQNYWISKNLVLEDSRSATTMIIISCCDLIHPKISRKIKYSASDGKQYSYKNRDVSW